MGIAHEQVKIIRVEQQSTAAAKDYRVRLGWRPAVVMVMNHKAAGILAIAVDGVTDAGKALSFGSDAAIAEQATAITIEDKGFKFGQNATLFKEDDAKLVFIALRNMFGAGVIDLADLPDDDESVAGVSEAA